MPYDQYIGIDFSPIQILIVFVPVLFIPFTDKLDPFDSIMSQSVAPNWRETSRTPRVC